MPKRDTSGPAFPVKNPNNFFTGMTLRDYFAAQALQGLLVGDHDVDYVLIADMSYQIANQMLIARDTV